MSVCKKCRSGLSEVCCFIKEPIKLVSEQINAWDNQTYCNQFEK